MPDNISKTKDAFETKKTGPAKSLAAAAAYIIFFILVSSGTAFYITHLKDSPRPMHPVPIHPVQPHQPIQPPPDPVAPLKEYALNLKTELDKNIYTSKIDNTVTALIKLKAGPNQAIISQFNNQGSQILLSNRPEHFIIAADISGSMMRGKRTESLKNLIKNILENLRESDFATLVTYNNSAEFVFENMQSGPDKSGLNKALALIDNISFSGGTNIEEALLKAGQAVKNSVNNTNDCINRIILISDGRPTVGKTDALSLENTIRPVFKDINTRITTIAMGTEVNTYLLARLSGTFGGQYIYSDALINGGASDIFNFKGPNSDNSSAFSDASISDINIVIKPASGCTLTKALLGTMRNLDNKSIFYVESIKPEHEKSILFSLNAPSLKQGETTIFTISGSYAIRSGKGKKLFSLPEQAVTVTAAGPENINGHANVPGVIQNSSINKLTGRVKAMHKLIDLSKSIENQQPLPSDIMSEIQQLSKEEAGFVKSIQASETDHRKASRKIHYKAMEYLNQQ
jgi:Mg-chelatase subunit ChlD